MRGTLVIIPLCFIAATLAGTGLRFSTKDPAAFAKFKGWNAKTNGTLQFHFKTHKENSFLIYEDDSGQCQFLYLSLMDGRLSLRLKMGNCEKTQTLLVGHNLADGKWHKVIVQRNYSETRVTVDDIFTNSTYYKGTDQFFGVKSDLFVGGISSYTQFNDLSFPAIKYESISSSFHGCISGVIYSNGRSPLREAQLKNTSGTTQGCLDPCSQTDQCLHGGKCLNSVNEVWCDCNGTGYEGPNCVEEATSIWLNGSGYIVFILGPKQEKAHSNYSYVAFSLRTETPHGIIFSLRSSKSDDYLLIEMVHGKLRVDLDLGQGELVLNGKNVQVDDNEWHWVELDRRGCAVTLKIDRKTLAGAEMPGKSFQLNVEGLKSKVHLGGGPTGAFIKSHTKMNFSGQLREFYFGDLKLLDFVVPTISNKQFATVGTVIDGSTITETSGSGCDPFDDDEDSNCAPTDPPSYSTDDVTSSTSEPTLDPDELPTGSQAYLSLPQVIPFWIILLLVVAAAIAISITIFFLYRWNTRYTGSFKPEQTSSSGDLPQHIAQLQNHSKPRISVKSPDEKI